MVNHVYFWFVSQFYNFCCTQQKTFSSIASRSATWSLNTDLYNFYQGQCVVKSLIFVLYNFFFYNFYPQQYVVKSEVFLQLSSRTIYCDMWSICSPGRVSDPGKSPHGTAHQRFPNSPFQKKVIFCHCFCLSFC